MVTGCREAVIPSPFSDDDAPCCAEPSRERQPQVVIELESTTSDRHEFVLRGVGATLIASLQRRGHEALASSFAVRVGRDGDLPSMTGEHVVVGNTILFRPRFPLTPGLVYQATWNPTLVAPHGRMVTMTFELPSVDRERTTLVADVFPSGDVLPENLLRFYVHFSAPMSRGFAYDCIELRDENDELVEDAFLELREELWNTEGTRFTLLFDPGRVKRDLVPNQESGTPLQAGRGYELVVRRTWEDAEGQRLRDDFRKQFRVVEPDATSPVPSEWKLTAPKAGSRTPLRVEFNESLDHALAHRTIRLLDANGDEIPGEAHVLDDETRWEFDSESPWSPGSYAIEVAPILEDVAGNSVGRPFEIDLSVPPTDHDRPVAPVLLPFVVEAPAD